MKLSKELLIQKFQFKEDSERLTKRLTENLNLIYFINLNSFAIEHYNKIIGTALIKTVEDVYNFLSVKWEKWQPE